MPELPEVETVKKILTSSVVGKKIKDVEVLRYRSVIGDPNEFRNALIGRTFKDIGRKGKYLIFFFDDEKLVISHLRMEGKYFLKNEGEPYTAHDMVVYHFNDGTYLVFNDTRHFGRMKLSNTNVYLDEPPLNKVGPDPFDINDPQILFDAHKNKTMAIKTALLKQDVMAGIGNIYADEILYRVGVHPETPANAIPLRKWDEILSATKDILSAAIKAGGSTIRSYHPAEGIDGKFQVTLKAYGKENQECLKCHNHFEKILVNGRGTTFCPKCQRNLAYPYIIGITGAIAAGKSKAARLIVSDDHVFDADLMVHTLYEETSFQRVVQSLFWENVIKDNKVDRKALLVLLNKYPEKKARLEVIVQQSLRLTLKHWLKKFKHDEIVVLEIPLLFEARFDTYCDKILFIDTSLEVRTKRLKARGDDVINALKLNSTLNHEENKLRADIVISNDKGEKELNTQLKEVLNDIVLHR